MDKEKRLQYLKLLTRLKGEHRKRLIEAAPLDLIKLISEIALNAIRGNLKISSKKRHTLQKHKKTLLLLSQKKVPLKVKKTLLIQRGGFLPALLAGLIPSVISLIAGR